MMAEQLSGEGDVLVKKTGEHVTRVHYEVTVTHSVQGRRRTLANVALDEHLARRLWDTGDVLTLRLDDGRSFDFFVQGVSGSGAVSITVTGGLAAQP